jgi:hypothetical protein
MKQRLRPGSKTKTVCKRLKKKLPQRKNLNRVRKLLEKIKPALRNPRPAAAKLTDFFQKCHDYQCG